MLDSGKVDLIAYDVPITEHYLKYVIPCGPENYTTQVLVQPKVQGEAPVTDITQLIGKDVYVEKDSKYSIILNVFSELSNSFSNSTVCISWKLFVCGRGIEKSFVCI